MAESKSEEICIQDPSEPVALATILLLQCGLDVTGENLAKLLQASKAQVDKRSVQCFADAMDKKLDLASLVNDYGKGGVAVGAAAVGGADAPVVDKPKEPTPTPPSSVQVAPGMFGDDSSSDDSD